MAQSITSVGFIGSGQLAERIARKLVTRIAPEQRFCYKKQRLVPTLQASDPSDERRKVFDRLGFATTAQNQQIISDCDLVFIGTNAREALAGTAPQQRAQSLRAQLKSTLFVSLMGDLPAEQVEHLICPGAKVIRMMPQSYLEQRGLPKGVLPPQSWATVRNTHASAEDVEKVLRLTGIASSVEITEQHSDLWAFNLGRAGSAAMVDDEAETEATTTEDHPHVGDFADDYQLGEFIGRGRFAEVYRVTHRATGKEFVVKCVDHDDAARDALMTEVAALSRLTHPNVIAHHGFYAEGDRYYLVLDHCRLGSVADLFIGEEQTVTPTLAPSPPVSEATARSILRQLLQALAYCHEMGQVHRDIKAENVLLAEDPHELGAIEVKLADFGLSQELDLVAGGRLQELCGTPQYLSPEIASGRTYERPADVWSAGILSYRLLTGLTPFDEAASEAHLHQLIRMGAVWYDQPVWDTLAPTARGFVQRMLELDPDARATAAELLAHPWLAA